ncbi:MAG: SOS response-associated peptidase [Acidimicrobiales bacterium]|nr:SOS response-associated peptidase [Acidimicrobiales bacterium]
MCGRFVSTTPPDELAKYFDAAPPAEAALAPNYNVAPTTDVYAVVENESRHLEAFHWGLVPFWAKDPSVGNRMINARADTLATKNAYRQAFKRRRCIVPADGFYEWHKIAGHKVKQPYFIHRVDDEPLAFAGLWEAWKPKGAEDDEVLRSTTIVTTDANATMSVIHDRMPVILPPSKWAEWLDPANEDVDSLAGLLVPAPPQLLTMHPVSTDVGNVRNRGAYLVDAIPESQVVGSGPEAR